MSLSKRIDKMSYSPIRKLYPLGLEAKARGIEVLSLNIGQPDIKTPPQFFEAFRTFDQEVLKYAESRGVPELLESFIKYYAKIGLEFTQDNLVVTNGGSEALYFTMFSIGNEGDEIILPEPFYTNYRSFTDLAGLNIVPVTTYGKDGFHLPSKDKFEAVITEKTKAILISNPVNPTGTVYTKEEIEMLGELCVENNLYLITDEVYREFVYGENEVFSPLQIKSIEDRVIMIDSISKRYSACGARIGLIASKNVEVMDAVMKLAQARLCVPTLEQVAAATLVDTPDSYFDDVKKEYELRRDTLFDGLISIDGVEIDKPEGAFYMMVKLPIKSAEHFCKWMLEEFSLNNTTAMMAPGDGFYETRALGIDEVRLSYCINVDDLNRAVIIIKEALITYKNTVEKNL